jgi:hypothetical protein
MADSCECHATNARYNTVNQPKTGYDYVPIVADDSLGFYVAYSAKQNDTNTGFVSTSCMYVLPLADDEVLVFGGGFGDTFYLPGGAYFDADYDAAMIYEAVTGCMQRDPATTRVRFLAPHGHPDHITVAFIKALERAGFTLAEIAYHEGDRAWIEQLPWLPSHPPLFRVLPGASCGVELLAYDSPLGRLWVTSRPGHTPGSIDLVLDVLGNPDERILIQGSASGGCPAPPGVGRVLSAHGTVMIEGPRRATVTPYNGKGLNRSCFSSVTPPRVGTTWVVEIDVSTHVGATQVFVFGSDCHFDPGLQTPFGELLVDPQGRYAFDVLRPVFALDREFIGMDLPRQHGLMGRVCFVQSAILGGGVELCNALRIIIGF